MQGTGGVAVAKVRILGGFSGMQCGRLHALRQYAVFIIVIRLVVWLQLTRVSSEWECGPASSRQSKVRLCGLPIRLLAPNSPFLFAF